MTDMFRQGDVLLMRVAEIPPHANVPVPPHEGRVVLALGEVTGHAHAVVGDAELLAVDLEEVEQRFLRVVSPAEVVHEEHDTLALPPGLYEVRRQREFNERGLVGD